MSGTVYLVGAGPGAVDLLTLRAARLLERADIVFHDALVHAEVLALAARAEKVAVGKRCGRHATVQHFINKQLVDAARKHAIVVRLKGGDPMLFGRAHEEITSLRRAGICVEVVPGVTAASAASADLAVSLTRRALARSVAFVTPRVGDGAPESSWTRAAVAADTVAIYMGAGEAQAIARALIDAGKPPATPVAIVEGASLPQARIVYGTLAELPALSLRLPGAPSIILLGEVLAEAAARAARSTARKTRAR